MKQLCIAIFLILSTFQAIGQCGTQTPPEYLEQYIRDINNLEVARNGRATTLYVPIFYHFIADNNGAGTKPFAEMLQSHCELNDAYASSDIQFYIAGIDTISNSNYYTFTTYQVGDQIMQAYNRANVCNVYICENPRNVCGYAFFPGSGVKGGGIFVKKSCYGTATTTLAHEMGHYLGLLHTFEGWDYNQEFVNGSNCSNAGDYLCDTPADFLDFRWSCPYTGNQTDNNGDLYRTVIDQTLYMSYSLDGCQNRFSPMQRTKTYTTLQDYRANLLNQPLPDMQPIDSVRILNPLSADSPVNSALVTFRWTRSPQAEAYLFTLTSNSGNIIYRDTILRDTVVTIPDLNPSWVYRFRVRPFSHGYTCTPSTPTVRVLTSSVKVPVAITQANSCGRPNSVRFPNAINGLPLIFNWSDGATDSVRTNLTPGRYQVTITEFSGADAITEVEVFPAPAPLQALIAPSASTLTALPSGGTAPFTYQWNTGSGNAAISNPVLGNTYSVTITDAQGCVVSANLVYNGINNLNTEHLFSVHPQPAIAGAPCYIEANPQQAAIALLKTYATDGRLMEKKEIYLSAGKNNIPVIMPVPGIYVLEFLLDKQVQRTLLVVQ